MAGPEQAIGDVEALALGLVEEKVSPAGEVEVALPDPDPDPDPEAPRPAEVAWVHQVNFYSNACERCGRGPAERKATPVCDGEPKGLNRQTAHRHRKEDWQERLGRDLATPVGQLPSASEVAARRVTTDDTLEGDLKASLEAIDSHSKGDYEEDPAAEATLGVQALPPTFEIPVDLEELPLFGYICGAAGVGKTFWAKEVARRAGDAVVLAATTGIASVNLGEGTTINSLLKYFDTASLRDAYTSGFIEAMLKKHRANGLQRILLDEVSMMSGDQLSILCHAFDNVNQDRADGVPEMGLLLLGDFAQLAPVPDRDPKDPKGFKKLPTVFAFESPEWERFADHTFTLKTIRRQADAEFIQALQACRRGAVGEALAYFGPRMVSGTDMDFPGPTIVAKNDAVGKFNQLRLDAVKGTKVTFASTRWGKVRPEWGASPKPAHEWGVPETLLLKEGCRVMILANKNVGGKDAPPVWAYTNGDLGTFIGPEGVDELTDLKGGVKQGTVARVRLDRTGTEVLVGLLERFNEIPLEPGRRKALKAEGHPERVSEDGKREYIGGITYVPLRLAYATTVHKSQGLSLDQVQVNIRDPFFAQPGMMYVALSRARSVEGLRLVGTPEGFRARCTVNPKLKGWL